MLSEKCRVLMNILFLTVVAWLLLGVLMHTFPSLNAALGHSHIQYGQDLKRISSSDPPSSSSHAAGTTTSDFLVSFKKSFLAWQL